MERWKAWLACGLLWMGAVQAASAADVEYKRGEFRFFVGPPPAFVQAHAIAPQWDPAAPGTDESVWRFWLLDGQVDRRKGADLDYTDYAYEPRSSTGIGDAGRVQIEFNPDYQRLVLHTLQVRRDGKWQDRLLPDKVSLARRESDFEKDMADGRVTALVVLDDVRVGDVVHIAYTIAGSNPILAGQAMDWRRMGWRSPILDAHFRVLYDPGTDARTFRDHGATAPVVHAVPGAVEARTDAHGTAPVVDEENYPNWFEPYPAVQVGVARTWGDVATWAASLFPKAGALPPDLEARLVQWQALPDDTARVAAALRAVQDDVRYFGVEIGDNSHRPADPAVTWGRRWGDCKDKAYLLATLLDRMHIPAVPALVNTDRGRAVADWIPTGAAFNHAIVRATLAGRTLWLDPTMTQRGGDPRDVDVVDYGVALPVSASTHALETIAPMRPRQSGVTTVERFQPSDDGALHLVVRTTYRGDSADYARQVIASSRSDDMQRRHADYYRQRYGALDITTPVAIADDREANALAINEEYVLKAPWVPDSGGFRALDVYGEALDGPATLPPSMARSGPLEVGAPGEYRYEVHFAVPQGWRPANAKETLHFASGAFDYTRALDVGDKEVTVVNAMQVTQRELTAAQANAHLGELRRMRESLGTRLRFQAPPARLESKERDARLKSLLRDVMEGGSK